MQPGPTIPPDRVVHLLGSWIEGRGPLRKRLTTALRHAIARGDLPEGARLPAERTLAGALDVSRSTVVAAYAALRDDALVASRQGSGTWIPRGERTARAAVPREADAMRSTRRSAVFRELLEGPGETIELLGAHLPACEALSGELLASCADELDALVKEPGYLPLGLGALRRRIAHHLTKTGLPTTEDQVLVTNGAQQAISLTAAFFLSRGDAVAVENPTYITAIDVFAGLGAQMRTLSLGPDGVRLDALSDAITHGAVRLVYLMPTFQNPTGTVVPERERREIARLAEAHGVAVVEDNSLADLSLGEEPPPPIGAFAKGAVLTIGSMSKLFWGGLRVGWIRGPSETILKLARLRIVSDLGSSIVSQVVATRLLARVDEVKTARRREAAGKLAHLSALLASRLPSWTFARPSGGLSLWVELPHGDANELADVALRHGVSVVPGSVASPDRSFADHLRIPFVLPEEEMTEAIDRLARAWAAYGPATERRRASLDVIV